MRQHPGVETTRPAWYDPRFDASIDEYLVRYSKQFATYPIFKGYDAYPLLWNGGHFQAGTSLIRLCYGHGRQDEHYIVLNDSEVEGFLTKAHGGKPGVYNVRRLLIEEMRWEAQYLNRRPIARI
jgi:hypothetical protein